MKAPDKIYLHEISAEELTKNLPYHVCYIRKDALLEWIDEYKNYSSGPSWDLLKTHIESL